MPLSARDRSLYEAWRNAIEGMTNLEATALMGGVSEETVRVLRNGEPSRIYSRTRQGMELLLAAKADSASAGGSAAGGSVLGSNRGTGGLAEPARIWVAEFLLKLTKAGCTEEEIDEVRFLLTKGDAVSYAFGGRLGRRALKPEDQLQLVKSIADGVVIPVLREAGRKVNAAWTR